MKNEKLKSCPFCGGEAKIMQAHNPYVICTKCHVSTPMFSWKADAIAAWNRRAEKLPSSYEVLPSWIPVSERLPESEEIVAVRCQPKNGKPTWNRAWYDAKNGFWHGSGSFAGVTHWMPISTELK